MEGRNFESEHKNTEPEEVTPEEKKRREKREYDKIRKIKINFLRDLLGDKAHELATRKMEVSLNVPGKKMVMPPLGSEKMHGFFLKQAWDNFVEPILDFENKEKEIEESGLSNRKKKRLLRDPCFATLKLREN